MRWIAVAAAFLLAAGAWGIAPGGARADETIEPLRLGDILSRDPLQAPAACANVSYGSGPPGGAAATLPPNPDGPTRVDVALFVVAVDEIDSAANSFRFEGYGGLIWCDPRQAFDAPAAGGEVRRTEGEEVARAIRGIWWPGLMLPTQLGQPDLANQTLEVHSDGTIEFSAKFNSRMIARYDFRRFPLDTQRLDIVIQVGRPDAGAIVIGQAPGRVGLGREFDIPEWEVTGYSIDVAPDERPARFTMTLAIGREVGYYLWKILLPLIIIVCVAWSTFWMTRDVLAQRQRQSGTAILTVVAFQFIAAADLPRVAYLTLMDLAILWTYLIIGGTLLTNIVNNRRFRAGEALGVQGDRIGRRYYLIIYLLGILAVFSLAAFI
jgi:hypothetical protein